MAKQLFLFLNHLICRARVDHATWGPAAAQHLLSSPCNRHPDLRTNTGECAGLNWRIPYLVVLQATADLTTLSFAYFSKVHDFTSSVKICHEKRR